MIYALSIMNSCNSPTGSSSKQARTVTRNRCELITQEIGHTKVRPVPCRREKAIPFWKNRFISPLRLHRIAVNQQSLLNDDAFLLKQIPVYLFNRWCSPKTFLSSRFSFIECSWYDHEIIPWASIFSLFASTYNHKAAIFLCFASR